MKPMILVVDDDEPIRMIVCHVLEGAGYGVISATNGKAALDHFKEQQPTMVLLDAKMPIMDGFSTCSEMRKLCGPDCIPILMLTSLSDKNSVSRAFEAGATDFITKPVNPALLVERVRFALKACETNVELLRSQKRLALAQRIAKVAYWEYDPTTDRMRWSEELSALLGRPKQEHITLFDQFLIHVHLEDQSLVRRCLADAVNDRTAFVVEYRIVAADGSWLVFYSRAEIEIDPQGKPVNLVGSLQDVTDLRHLEERVDHLVNFDHLTTLPNRLLLRDRFRQAILEGDQDQTLTAVLIVDLDRFKTINDTLGASIGDAVLQTVSKRLRSCVRDSDTVARLGGDEFAIVVRRIIHSEEAAKTAQVVLDALSQPMRITGQELVVTASIGIAVHPDDGFDEGALLGNADVAMSRAREKGGDAYCYFTPEMNVLARERLTLENDLRNALAEQQFFLEYQPRLDMSSGRVNALEALIRWRSPQHGVVSPARFIPVLEETGLIVEVGARVFQQACGDLQQLHEAGLPSMSMAINLSSRQLQTGLSALLVKALDDTGLRPESVELEITESVIMEDAEDALGLLADLKEIGVSLAIDDFGTGYSSLAYLSRLPVDVLKIDRSFVTGMVNNSANAVIVRSTIELGHSLGLKVVAEGVEEQAELDALKELGCDEAQGFLIARPMKIDALVEWLDDHRSSLPSTGSPAGKNP